MNKQNIFATFMPKTIELPFATIRFLAEPVLGHVAELNQLPNLVLPMVNSETAEVQPFYLRVTRHSTPAANFDATTAKYLLHSRVADSISEFATKVGEASGSEHIASYSPQYSFMCYDHSSAGGTKLRPDADNIYFRELENLALPSPTFTPALYSLAVGDEAMTLSLQLTETLAAVIKVGHDQPYATNKGASDLNYLYGRCRLFDKDAFLQVGPTINYLIDRQDMPLRNWISGEVAATAIRNELYRMLQSTFGGAADDLFHGMLTEIEFNV